MSTNMDPVFVFLFPRWEVSGVTSLNLDLAAALRDLGARCLLVVEEDNRESSPYELPDGIECRSLLSSKPWWRHVPSNTLRHQLQARAAQRSLGRILASCGGPVALIPGYAHAFCPPGQSWGKDVGIIGVVHAADEGSIGFAVRSGAEWARCICVSEPVARETLAAAPSLRPILSVIQNGVRCPAAPPVRSAARKGQVLRVVYAGRLEQKQKRIHDLADLVGLAAERKLAIEWDIAGEGPEQNALRNRLTVHIQQGTVRWHGALKRTAVRDLLREADVMLLLSAYEGMPMSLLEAMAEGCVPVVTDGCDAGAELIRRHDAGFVLPTGDVQSFAETLHSLAENREQLVTLGKRAWATVANGPHNAVTMANSYRRVIAEWLTSRHKALGCTPARQAAFSNQ